MSRNLSTPVVLPWRVVSDRLRCTLLRFALPSLAVAGPLAATPMLSQQDPAAEDELLGLIAERVDELREELVAVRRDLHRHPELSGQEKRTAGVVATRLRALGLDVRTGVGGHGVVGVLRGGKPGPVVGYRADMDAVADPAPDPVPFASVVEGVRHICGHDVHTTVGLGVAEALVAIRSELPGTVKFLFQPAEENATGSRAMIADGALEDPTPSAIFGLHTSPLTVGQVGVVEAAMFYGRDSLTATFVGEGDLAAAVYEFEGVLDSVTTVGLDRSMLGLAMIDPGKNLVLARVIESTPQLDQKRWRVTASCAVTTREISKEVMEALRIGLGHIGIPGVRVEVGAEERQTSGVYNDPELTRGSCDVLSTMIGEDNVVHTKGVGPAFSEDFGFFLEDVPGVYYWLGVSNPEKGTRGVPHTPDYVADEGAIGVGAKAMAGVLLDYLRTH